MENDISEIKAFSSLPDKMKLYINYLNKSLDIPVKYISNGPGQQADYCGIMIAEIHALKIFSKNISIIFG